MVRVTYDSGFRVEEFTVHRKSLVATSNYFKRVVAGHGALIRLAGTNPSEFAVYLTWLYTGLICCKDEDRECDSQEYHELIELYSLGQRLEDDAFTEAVVDAFRASIQDELQQTDTILESLCIGTLYDSTNKSNPLRRLVVETYARHATSEQVHNMVKRVPAEFMDELNMTLLNNRPDTAPGISALPLCMFHKHAGSGKCAQEAQSRKRRRLQ